MFLDAHAHLDWYDDKQLDDAIEQIQSQEIYTIAVSMDVDSFQRNKEIAHKFDYIIPSFGIHPWEADRFSDDLSKIDQYIEESPMIGEVGLDYHFVEELLDYIFHAVSSQQKIVNLHTKGAEEGIVKMLEEFRISPSIIHWYSGPLDLIERYLAAGAYFTIGVELFFSSQIADLLDVIPDERLLTETDNPGGYKWLTQHVGMPELIKKVVRTIGEHKGMSKKEVALLVAENFETLIEKSPEVMTMWKSLPSRL